MLSPEPPGFVFDLVLATGRTGAVSGRGSNRNPAFPVVPSILCPAFLFVADVFNPLLNSSGDSTFETGAVIGDAPSLLILVNAEGSIRLPFRKKGRLPGVPPSLEPPLVGSLLEVLMLFGVVE